jgi:hypothetical protein
MENLYFEVSVSIVFLAILFNRGTKVQLLDGANVNQIGATIRIIRFPRIDSYHGKLIFEKYYSVGVEDVMDGKVPLFVTNKAYDPPQLHLKDIVGTATLWDREYLVLTNVPDSSETIQFGCLTRLCLHIIFCHSTIRSTCLKWTKGPFTSLVNNLQRLLKKLVWIRVVRIHGC